MSKDSRRFHPDFGTTVVVCIGAISLTAGLIYSFNRPEKPKSLTTQRQERPSARAEAVNSSPNPPAPEGATEGVPPPKETALANPTVSTEPGSTTGGKTIELSSTSPSAAPRSNSGPGRLDGNGSVIVLGREAGAALELSQHPERLSKLIQNGSLFTVPRGTAIKLVQGNRLGNRLVIKVLIMSGSKVGQEGWAKTWPVSP